jgi:hypothetical protein
MRDLFGHEKLHVYQKAVKFVTEGDALLQIVEQKVAA